MKSGHPTYVGLGMIRIAVIADDLTGAADTGVQFLQRVPDVLLISHDRLLRSTPLPSSWGLAVYTSSRSLPPSEAAARLRRVGERLRELEPRLVFKKVDSCLRGNLGPEVEALMGALGLSPSFVAPAFPGMGRTTFQDVHLLHGVPVAQTEMGRDPVTPVTESRLSALLAGQCHGRVAALGLEAWKGGSDPVAREVSRLITKGVRHLTFDVETQADLDRIAALGLEMGALLVGSAGLAQGTARALKGPNVRGEIRQDVMRRPGHHLLVCGSLSPRARAQVAALAAAHPCRWIQVPPATLADPREGGRLWALAWDLAQGLKEGNVLVTTEAGGHGREGTELLAPAEVAAGLSAAVAEAVKAASPASLFLTGGDTAEAVLQAMGAGGIRLLGEVVQGMPLGRLLEGPLMGLPVVTKAGAFGEEDALVRWREFWSRRA